MRILGHFSFYLRIHDNMFTVLGGFRVSLTRITVPSVYPYFFLLVISPGISEDAECIRTDAIRYENTFLPDYKLPVDVDR